MRIFETANYQFIPNRRIGYIISGILLTVSLFALVTRGLEVGIDFRGGMEFVIDTEERLDPVQVRTSLTPYVGMEPETKTYDDRYILIRVASEEEINVVQNAVVTGVNESFPGANAQVVRTDIVGPRFADDLRRAAIFAVLGSLLVIFVYILIRFEWRYGMGAVAALFHDVTIVLGIFSLFHGILPFSLQMDQAIIAAFLTIVGYSLNDTVVVFDRVREYANLFKTEQFNDVVNRSINATLSRTVVTSGTTLLVVTTLFIFGGEVLRGFAFALILGVMIGTYSSIFVASPVVVELRAREARRAAA